MISYPDVHADGSWADATLKALNYNTNPAKLQLLISKIFVKAVSKITVPNSMVVPVPLFQVLDGSDPDDYVLRVELSIQVREEGLDWDRGMDCSDSARVWVASGPRIKLSLSHALPLSSLQGGHKMAKFLLSLALGHQTPAASAPEQPGASTLTATTQFPPHVYECDPHKQ